MEGATRIDATDQTGRRTDGTARQPRVHWQSVAAVTWCWCGSHASPRCSVTDAPGRTGGPAAAQRVCVSTIGGRVSEGATRDCWWRWWRGRERGYIVHARIGGVLDGAPITGDRAAALRFGFHDSFIEFRLGRQEAARIDSRPRDVRLSVALQLTDDLFRRRLVLGGRAFLRRRCTRVDESWADREHGQYGHRLPEPQHVADCRSGAPLFRGAVAS